jgi:hypothetical protein
MMSKQAASSQLYTGIMYSLPLVADINLALNDALPVWPERSGMMTADVIQNANEGRAEISLLLATLKIEEGNMSEAKKILARIITEYGETRPRTLATAYFLMMEENAASLLEQTRSSAWEEFEYPGEKMPSTQPNAQGSSTKPPASLLAPN